MRRMCVRACMSGLAMMLTIGGTPVVGAVLPDSTPVAEPERHGVLIGGRVFDTNREPVGGAHVALLTPDGEVIQRTQTNDRGIYRFRPVRPGVYLVRGFKEGVGRDQERVRARRGHVRVRLVLE